MRNKILVCLGLAILLIVSCQPEIESGTDKTYKSVSEFIKSNQAKVQPFAVSATTGGDITTTKGIKIHFPDNAFVTLNGTPVTDGVTIEVKEILTPADMILNDMPTVSGPLPIESGGEFNIKATKNGQPLRLASGKFVKIDIPGNMPGVNSMQVFNGKVDAQGNVDWAVNNNPGNFVVRDSVFSKQSLFCDSVDWINCDKFINEPTVEYSVYPGNAPGNDSTCLYVHLTGRNAVVRMYWTTGLNYFKSNQLLAVPSTLVGISVKNGKLYASLTPVNIQQGQSTTMNFAPYTEADLKVRLAQLH